MAVWALRLQLFVSALVFLYVGAAVLLDPEGQSRASFKAAEQKVHRFTLLEAINARLVGAYCFGLGVIMQGLAILVHDRTALLVVNYALILFYALMCVVRDFCAHWFRYLWRSLSMAITRWGIDVL